MPVFQSEERYKNMSKQAMYDEILELKERNAELKEDNSELKVRLQAAAPPQPALAADPVLPPALPVPAMPAYPDLSAENLRLVDETRRLNEELSSAQHSVASSDARIASLERRVEELAGLELAAVERAEGAEVALQGKAREISGLKAKLEAITKAHDELVTENATMVKTITDKESELSTRTRELENSEGIRAQLKQDAARASEAHNALVTKLRETIGRLDLSKSSASDAAAEQLRRDEERLASERKELHTQNENVKRAATQKVLDAERRMASLFGSLRRAHKELQVLQKAYNHVASVGMQQFEQCMKQKEELSLKNHFLEKSIQTVGKGLEGKLTAVELRSFEAQVADMPNWGYAVDRTCEEYKKAQKLFASTEECGLKPDP